MTRIFAAADIGSNTAHLLVAATDGNLVMRIDNFNEWIALGETVAKQKEIPKESLQQLITAVKEFKRVANAKQAESLYVFATEGVRMAKNHEAALKKIFNETGVKVEIISPAREAELSFRAVMLDTKHYGCDMLMEVGGGSAQIGRISRGKLVQEVSLPLGTGRVIAESDLRSPCPDYAFQAAESYIQDVLDNSGLDFTAKRSVVSGGVGRGLWRAIHPDSEKVMMAEELDYIIWSASRLPPDRIVARFGVKQKRAGTLLPGALVYRALMRKFGVKEIVVSEFGIREGAVLEMAAGRIAKCPV